MGKRIPVPKSIRNKVCARQRYDCLECGERFKESINIHHVDGDNSNNNPDNLIAVCHSCHDEIHNEEAVQKHLSKKEIKKEMEEEEYSLDFISPAFKSPEFKSPDFKSPEFKF